MEIRPIWKKYTSPNIIIQKPDWFYDIKKNFNYAREADLSIFRETLLKSWAIFGLPSTVVIECGIVNKPFFNFLFTVEKLNLKNNVKSAWDMWNFDHYEFAREYKAAIGVTSTEELKVFLSKLKSDKNSFSNQLNGIYVEKEISSIDFTMVMKQHIDLIAE